MRTAPVPAQADPGVAPAPARAADRAVLDVAGLRRGIESSGWLRWLLDRWGLAYREVTAEEIKAGGLGDAEVLLVPDGYATHDPDFPEDPYGLADLGPEGQAAIRTWVEGGGRYVGWLDGAVLAAGVGVSSATFESAADAGISSPGALIRTIGRRGAARSRTAWAASAYAFWDSRYVMSANGAPAPVRFPAAATEDFFVSGIADGAEALGGTAAVVDEPVGDGRTVAFGFEPNFRAFTDGTQRLLRNAILGADPRRVADAGDGRPRQAAGARGPRRAPTPRRCGPRTSRCGSSCEPVRRGGGGRGAGRARAAPPRRARRRPGDVR